MIGLLGLFGGPPAEWQLKQAREAKARRDAMPAVAWSETMKWAPLLKIDGSTWTPPKLFDLQPHGLGVDLPCVDHGEWSYHHLHLPAGEQIGCILGARRGQVFFTTDVVVPAIYQRKRQWMSFTPQEWFTLRPGLKFATGRVVVGGLGMGVQLRAIAKKRSVTEIVVVERSIELVDFVGRRMVEDISCESGKPVRIDIGDAFEIATRMVDEKSVDSILFDIWPHYGTARTDYQWLKLRRRADRHDVKTWAWGGAGTPNTER